MAEIKSNSFFLKLTTEVAERNGNMPIPAGYIVPHPPLIIPDVGKGQERAIQSTIDGYHKIARSIARLRPDTVIVISPHSVIYSDYIHVSPGNGASGSFGRFGVSRVYEARYDAPLTAEISGLCGEYGFPAGTLGEKDASLDHGTLIPVHFINQYYSDYRLVRCSVSGLSRARHYEFGMIVREAVDKMGINAVVIASGDLSHKLNPDGPYGFVPEGPELDKQLVDVMKSGNFGGFFDIDEDLCEKGAQCGLDAFVVMSGMFDKRAVSSHFYSYEGPYGVGYAICAFEDTGRDEHRAFLDMEKAAGRKRIEALRAGEDIRVKIAREALESFINTKELPSLPDKLPKELTDRRAGVFVSVKKHGRLRGCIGTIEPAEDSIAEEIRRNAVSSGTRDPRFDPVTSDELCELVYSVDVLSPASYCTERDLDVKRYGVIVTSGNKKGLLLPDIDGVDTVKQQIDIARQKAGILPSEKCTLERFEVIRYK